MKKTRKNHAFALLSDAIIREMLSFSKLGHGSKTKPPTYFLRSLRWKWVTSNLLGRRFSFRK